MKRIFVLLTLCTCLSSLSAQEYQPTKENLEARQWFGDAKFGLFIHWGVYSVLGDGEWVMNNQNISINEYEKLPSFFNPIDFSAEEWVAMAKVAGMKYITITSRHHDGFSMFDSKATEYTITNKTPYKKDVLKKLAIACEKEGIKLFFYYSLLDWHDDNYFPRGRTGNGINGREEGDWDKYIDFMKAQLSELLTNYGDVGGIWFDGHWDKKDANWHYDEIYQLIHDLQPQCLVGNNHHQGILEGEDFQMFEKDLPGRNTTGFGSHADDIGALPKEVCETINGSWGFNLQDRRHKSDEELIQYLIKAAGYGSNLLLNVGPMPSGKIQEEHVNSLKKIGDWLKIYGETIYNTKEGPLPPTDDLVLTTKGKKVYFHVLKSDINVVFVPSLGKKIESINFFSSKRKAVFKTTAYGVLIEIPENEKNSIDIVLEATII
ncbi:MAG: alpha-L-fucosidase [Reichenbachiella sp.]